MNFADSIVNIPYKSPHSPFYISHKSHIYPPSISPAIPHRSPIRPHILGPGAKSDVYDCFVISVVRVVYRVWAARGGRESAMEVRRVGLGGRRRRLAVARRPAGPRSLSLLGDCRLRALASHLRSLPHVRIFIMHPS